MFNKFKEQLQLIRESIFKGATKEEIIQRREDYDKILEQEIINEFKDILIKNEDGSYDTKSTINLSRHALRIIPIKFRQINGDFIINHNHIVSLRNSPEIVLGNFDCAYNSLSTLRYGPAYVQGAFICGKNNIEFTEEDAIRNGIKCKIFIGEEEFDNE